MRSQRRDDDELRELLTRAATSWTGPSPLASQSRWAARRRMAQTARGFAVGFALTVVAGLTLTAVTGTPGGAATEVMHYVSHAFPATPGTPAGPAPTSASASPGRDAQTRIAVSSPTPRPTIRPAPSPRRSAEPEHRWSPLPSPAPSASAGSNPSPGPSLPPDD